MYLKLFSFQDFLSIQFCVFWTFEVLESFSKKKKCQVFVVFKTTTLRIFFLLLLAFELRSGCWTCQTLINMDRSDWFKLKRNAKKNSAQMTALKGNIRRQFPIRIFCILWMCVYVVQAHFNINKNTTWKLWVLCCTIHDLFLL